MKPGLLLTAIPLLCTCLSLAAEKPRLAVLTDIGGDPDDQQAMVRLMVYSNEFEIEMLMASAAGIPGELKESVTRPELIRSTIEAYGKVLPNLKKHAPGWPEKETLLAKVKSGNPLRGRENIGEGHDTEGSKEIIRLVDGGSQRNPLNISVWGGQTDLAQAFWRVKHDRGGGGFAEFAKRMRVYDIDDQDHLAEWIRGEFPGLFYILAKAYPGEDKRKGTYRGMYLTGDESLTSRAWIESNVTPKGPLGALYPTKTWTAPNPNGCMKEGDSPSWFFFLPAGGNDPADPTKPGWGGHFLKEPDGWYRDSKGDGKTDPRTAVSQWRPAFQQDFAKRMIWCMD